jgi:hypothetical protein
MFRKRRLRYEKGRGLDTSGLDTVRIIAYNGWNDSYYIEKAGYISSYGKEVLEQTKRGIIDIEILKIIKSYCDTLLEKIDRDNLPNFDIAIEEYGWEPKE